MAERKGSGMSVANFVLQLLAIGLAILFGVYTALAYPISKNSLQQAQIANQLSLLSFCTSGASVNTSWSSPCSEAATNLNFTEIVVTLAPQPSTPGQSPPKTFSTSDKIALGVGLGFGVPAFFASIVSFCMTARR